MKVGILAGGRGSRLSEETDKIPKPMVKIGDKPILDHIIDFYRKQGHGPFYIATGHLCKVIHWHYVDVLDVFPIFTGDDTMTGGRIKRLMEKIGERCFMTYGDGLTDVDLDALLEQHENVHPEHPALATVTAIQPPARFGALTVNKGGFVTSMEEKPQDDEGGWINGGFFVLEPYVSAFIEGDDSIWERWPMQYLAETFRLRAHKHTGFWQCMDTLRDRERLEEIWASGAAPWAS